MSDASGLDAAHPMLVTAVGPPGVPPTSDATGLPAAHPALVTATGTGRSGPAAPTPPGSDSGAPAVAPAPQAADAAATAARGGAPSARPAPILSVPARKHPGLFRRRGLRVVIVLRAPAEVVMVLHAAQDGRRLARTRTATLPIGRTLLRLPASRAGRRRTRRHARVDARLEVSVRYEGGGGVHLRAPVSLRTV